MAPATEPHTGRQGMRRGPRHAWLRRQHRAQRQHAGARPPGGGLASSRTASLGPQQNVPEAAQPGGHW
eukprot:11216411-Lingulodinium_polyedra.AAC.1